MGLPNRIDDEKLRINAMPQSTTQQKAAKEAALKAYYARKNVPIAQTKTQSNRLRLRAGVSNTNRSKILFDKIKTHHAEISNINTKTQDGKKAKSALLKFMRTGAPADGNYAATLIGRCVGAEKTLFRSVWGDLGRYAKEVTCATKGGRGCSNSRLKPNPNQSYGPVTYIQNGDRADGGSIIKDNTITNIHAPVDKRSISLAYTGESSLDVSSRSDSSAEANANAFAKAVADAKANAEAKARNLNINISISNNYIKVGIKFCPIFRINNPVTINNTHLQPGNYYQPGGSGTTPVTPPGVGTTLPGAGSQPNGGNPVVQNPSF